MMPKKSLPKMEMITTGVTLSAGCGSCGEMENFVYERS
jgi:hypothetical protein